MPLGAIFRSLWILANILDSRTAYDGVAGVLAGDVHHFHNSAVLLRSTVVVTQIRSRLMNELQFAATVAPDR